MRVAESTFINTANVVFREHYAWQWHAVKVCVCVSLCVCVCVCVNVGSFRACKTPWMPTTFVFTPRSLMVSLASHHGEDVAAFFVGLRRQRSRSTRTIACTHHRVLASRTA